MANISQKIIDDILDKVDIVSVVSETVSLEKQGKNYFGLCPFHNEKTPSFSVSPEKKIYKCFSCHAGGNVINYVKEYYHIPYVEAVKRLADRVGIEIDYKETKSNTLNEIDKKYYEINQESKNFYEFYLRNTQEGKVALDYLHNRGLSDNTIKMFDIGLSPSKYDLLYKTLTEKNHQANDLIDLGLVRHHNDFYDLFRYRIIFPIVDEVNRVVGFSGRTYLNNDDNQPKYVNSPQTVIFNKSKVLYNLNNAISEINRTKRVVLLEGFMDVIAAYNAGVKDCVATMGTSLTNDHAKLLKNYTNKVVICYDGDSAGFEATFRAINILDNYRFDISVVRLPDNLDPDDYIKSHSKEKFVTILMNDQINKFDFIYRYHQSKFDLTNYFDIDKFKKIIFQLMRRVNEKLFIEIYLKKLSIDMNISYESLREDYYDFSHGKKVIEVPTKQNKMEFNQYENAEITITRYMLKNKEYSDYVFSKIGDSNFIIHDNKGIVFRLKDLYKENTNVDLDKFYRNLLPKQTAFFDEHYRNYHIFYNNDELDECIAKLLEYPVYRRMQILQSKIYSDDCLEEELITLAKERDKLLKNRKK